MEAIYGRQLLLVGGDFQTKQSMGQVAGVIGQLRNLHYSMTCGNLSLTIVASRHVNFSLWLLEIK